MDNDSMDLKRLRYLIHAIYGSVNTAMDKWLPSEQWQRAEKLHLS